MPWRVERAADHGIIETTYTGSVAASDVRAATAEALSLARPTHAELFLTFFEDADLRLSTTDIFAVPEEFKSRGANRGNRLGVVVTGSGSPSVEDARFYENVCRNRGWQVRMFSSRADAVSWLLS